MAELIRDNLTRIDHPKADDQRRSQSLFRQEAVEHQSQQVWGGIVLRTPWLFTLSALLSLLFFAATMVFLNVGEYARKQSVRGYVTPTSGVVKLYAESSGYFTEVSVKEGQWVEKGDALITIMKQHRTDETTDLFASQRDEIDLQVENLLHNIELSKRDQTIAREQRKRLIGQSQEALALLKKQVLTQESRLELAKSRYERYARLNKSNMISKVRVEEMFDEYLAQTEVAQQLAQQLLNRESSIAQQRDQLERDDMEGLEAHNRMVSQLSFLRERRLLLERDRMTTLSAPVAGRVTNIQAMVGENALPNVPLLSIVPESQQYDAYLYVPTRAIGSIESSQEVRFKLDAFPYQKYGFYGGEVREVSKNVFTPAELDVPVALHGPVYRVIARINQDEKKLNGVDTPEIRLQSGMTLTAEITYDRRTLMEWLLGPIYALRS